MTETPEFPEPGFPVRWPVPTRWADNDHYGHVNNVAYYSYFDTAVNAWLMHATGTDTRDLPAIGVVAETSCRFLRQISFPDQLEVGIACEKLGNRSVVYRLAVFRAGEDEPAAIGRFVHVYVDEQTRQPIAVPEPIRKAVEGLLDAGTSDSSADEMQGSRRRGHARRR